MRMRIEEEEEARRRINKLHFLDLDHSFHPSTFILLFRHLMGINHTLKRLNFLLRISHLLNPMFSGFIFSKLITFAAACLCLEA